MLLYFLQLYQILKLEIKKKQKIKKRDFINLALEENIDILNYVSNHNSLRPKLVIGFAAETNDMINNAKKKLIEKNCDWIIANNISNKLKIESNISKNAIRIHPRPIF